MPVKRGHVSTLPVEPATGRTELPQSGRRSAEWDIRAGAGNYGVLVVTQIVASGASFAAVFVALRSMGAEGYGRVAAVIAAAQLVMQLALNWSTFSLGRFGGEEFNRSGRIAHSFWTRLSLLLLPLLAVVIASPLWLPRLSEWLRIAPNDRPLVLAYLVVCLLWMHVQQALQAAKLQRLRGVLLAAERTFILAVLVGLALTRRAHLLNVLAAYIVAASASCAAGLWHVRRLIRPVRFWDRPLLAKMLRFSLPLIPTAFAGYLTGGYLDALFITRYLTLADLGTYSVAYAIVGSFLQLPTLLNALLLSLFVSLQAEGRDESIRRYLRNVSPLLALGWSAACSLAAASCGYLLPLLPGPEYETMARLMWPLMAMAALSGPVLLGLGAVINAWSATHLIPIAALTQAIANVALNVLWIPRYGLVGCAWASVAASGIGLVVLCLCINKRLPGTGLSLVLATLPPVVGSAVGTWRQSQWIALAAAVLTGLVIGWWQRHRLLEGALAIRSSNAIPLPGGLLRRLRGSEGYGVQPATEKAT
jgi:O-antigen/teichoic acid export membrane protein